MLPRAVFPYVLEKSSRKIDLVHSFSSSQVSRLTFASGESIQQPVSATFGGSASAKFQVPNLTALFNVPVVSGQRRSCFGSKNHTVQEKW